MKIPLNGKFFIVNRGLAREIWFLQSVSFIGREFTGLLACSQCFQASGLSKYWLECDSSKLRSSIVNEPITISSRSSRAALSFNRAPPDLICRDANLHHYAFLVPAIPSSGIPFSPQQFGAIHRMVGWSYFIKVRWFSQRKDMVRAKCSTALFEPDMWRNYDWCSRINWGVPNECNDFLIASGGR